MPASAFGRLLQLLIQTTHFRIKIGFSFWSPASAFNPNYTFSYMPASAVGRLLQLLIQITHFWI
jgi:hypothetical protein